MYQFFVENENVSSDSIRIIGQDAKHIRNVLRMKKGEVVRVSTAASENFLCEVADFIEDDVIVAIKERNIKSTELPGKVYLFQAIPKGDRMETVIEKCVELGVHEIIPVEMKNCIVKLDEKKKANRLKRYQAIAEAAAKQSKRSIVPNVHEVMKYKEAVDYALSNSDVLLFPYEREDGMKGYNEVMDKIVPGKNISFFIGPEGGFDEEEVSIAKEHMDIISLGSRILRTDTAAIVTMTAIMLKFESEN
ncbi:MAG: 16S rRNA (uracil(1498)-N(3))-methyltransferase [Lachnospiraceae bacterium]|nr:16S rRNA (uracil(1498)-N(3))-methyltransferase [Lachnospiraceae bacterium]